MVARIQTSKRLSPLTQRLSTMTALPGLLGCGGLFVRIFERKFAEIPSGTSPY